MAWSKEQRKRYPENWRDIRWRILGIANYRCEHCGVRYGEIHPLTGNEVILQIAHLNHTPEDCRDENLRALRALCPTCHGKYDGQHRARLRREAKIKAAQEAKAAAGK